MIRAVLSAFTAGVLVMALEILASRWMAPGLGFTLTTWAFLISVTLLAGAIGAVWGGRLACTPGRSRLAWLLGVAGAWTGALAMAAPVLVDALDAVDVTLGAAIAAAVLVGPPAFLLGAVLPVATALARPDGAGGGGDPGGAGGDSEDGIGSTVGRLVAASTLGSLLGTLLAAFLLVPRLGLEPGALLLGGLGVAAAAFVGLGGRHALVVVLAAGCGTALLPDRASESGIEVQTPYGLLTLRRAPHAGWTLAIDGVAQARVSPMVAGPGALLARRQYTELLPHLRPLGTRALQVGLGGGLVSNTLRAYGIEVETIELNPGIVTVMRDQFGFDGNVRVGDGRAVWRRLAGRYDFVVLDAFQGEAVPAHLLTREALAELRARLTPRGIVCIHLIGTPGHEAVGAVARTLDDVFANVRAARSGVGEGLQDLFLFGSDGALALPANPELVHAGWLGNEWFTPNWEGVPVLTDDRNPLDVLNEPLARALRRASRTR